MKFSKIVIIELDLDTSKIHLHTTPSFNPSFRSQVIIRKQKMKLTGITKRGITLVSNHPETKSGWTDDTHYNSPLRRSVGGQS